MPLLIGKKIGMTSVYDADRRYLACTLVEATPNVVTQVKTVETDGYQAIQFGFGERKEKHSTKAMIGHFKKAGTSPKRIVAESAFFTPVYYKQVENEGKVTWEGEQGEDLKAGDSVGVNLFRPGDTVAVVGTTKGKGFQGVVKRYGFAGVGGRTHGQHNRARHPGSMGPGSTPARVYPKKRLPGRMGGNSIKVTGLKVLKVVPEKNLLVISGALPGHNGSIVFIEK